MEHKKYEAIDAVLNPHKRLANAIVIEAAKEYKTYLRILTRNQNNTDAFLKVQSLERFFLSEWFGVLTNVDGEYIMGKIKKELHNERMVYDTNHGGGSGDV